MKRGVALLALLAVYGPWGCGGTSTGDGDFEPGRVAGLDLAGIEARIRPYDLSGRTLEGLALLDAWLALEPAPADHADGSRLRAAALSDLWVYARVAAALDDEAADAAFDVVATQLGAVPLPATWGPDEQVALARQLTDQVAADLTAASAPSDALLLADALVSWSPQAEAPPPESILTAGEDRRARLLLAARLYLNDQRQAALAGEARARLADEAWLCDGERGEETAILAERCGYWCATLPEAPVIAPAEERDVYELGGDDTPVEFDDAPFEPEAYAEAVGTDGDDSPWFPTPGDPGYELVRACGADYFGLPAAGGLVLLNQRNYLDLVYLGFAGDLMATLELDLLQGDPLVVLGANLLGRFADHYTRGGLAQDLTPAALQYDARLELPRWRSATPGDAVPESRPAPNSRLLLMRSDGISLSLPPRLRLQVEDGRYAIVWAESEAGYHYPGREVVELPRLNRLDDDQVSDDRIPILRRDLEDLEQVLAREAIASDGSAEPAACGAPADTGLVVLADGSTFFETLRPALKTVTDCGYAPVELVTIDADGGAVLLALDLVTEPVEGIHELQIENGRFSFRAAGTDPESDPFRPERDDEQPFSTLYRHLLEGLEEGSIDPQQPLLVTVAHERVDVGMLSVALQLVRFRRDGDPTSDVELLSAPVTRDADGHLVRLFPAGVLINLR